MQWSLTGICLMCVAVPATALSALGYACAPRRATKTYLAALIALCLAVAVAWTFWPDPPALPEGAGQTRDALIGWTLILASLALVPATAVYLCVSGAVASRRIVPLALAGSLVALPPWLWLSIMVLHYLIGVR